MLGAKTTRSGELAWVNEGISRLERTVAEGRVDEIRAELERLVPEYAPAGA